MYGLKKLNALLLIFPKLFILADRTTAGGCITKGVIKKE